MNIVLFEGDCFFPRNDDRYQHIRKILKKGPGDSFFAGIIDGPEGTATITSLDDTGVSFTFREERPTRPLYPVSVIIGFPRPIQLKRLLRDVASLGVSEVLLIGTELGEKSYRESTLVGRGAARESLVEGCMQAGSSAVPSLDTFDSIEDAIRAVCGDSSPASGVPANAAGAPRARLILLDTVNPECSLIQAPLEGISRRFPLVLAIGSERGWTARERALFRNAGFMVCSLGSRILRTETAATAALGIALAMSGFMEGRE
jgi:RsmE family RNA methyltransferase